MYKTPHFETGHFQSHAFHLPSEEYSRALDCLVKACTDLLLVTNENKPRIFLGKRKVEPQPDFWFAGGRMKPGETPPQSAARIIKRELGIEISDPGRYDTVGHYSFVWEKREQPPIQNGTADISIVLTVELTKEEIQRFRVDETEYSEFVWIEPHLIVSDAKFHPALRKATQDYLAMKLWKKLEFDLQSNETTDKQVRDSLRTFIGFKQKSFDFC